MSDFNLPAVARIRIQKVPPHLCAWVQLAKAWHGTICILAIIPHSALGVGYSDCAHWGVVKGAEGLIGLSLQACSEAYATVCVWLSTCMCIAVQPLNIRTMPYTGIYHILESTSSTGDMPLIIALQPLRLAPPLIASFASLQAKCFKTHGWCQYPWEGHPLQAAYSSLKHAIPECSRHVRHANTACHAS